MVASALEPSWRSIANTLILRTFLIGSRMNKSLMVKRGKKSPISSRNSWRASRLVKKVFLLSVLSMAVALAITLLLPPSETPSQLNPLPAVTPEQLWSGVGPVPQTLEEFHAECEAAFARLDADAPDSPETLAIRALYLSRIERAAEAEACWEQALKLAPRFLPALIGAGLAAVDRQDFEKAQQLLTQAVSQEGENEEAYVGLIRAFAERADWEKAAKVAEQFVKRFPDISKSHFRAGEVYVGQKDFSKARDEFELALAVDPSFSPAHYSLATVYLRLGNAEAAKSHREQFAKIKGELLEAERQQDRSYDDRNAMKSITADNYRAIGDVYLLKLKQSNKAEACWIRGLQIDPCNDGCRESILYFYQQQQRVSAAVSVLRSASLNCDSSAALWNSLALLEQELGELPTAIETVERGLHANPDDSDLLLTKAKLYLSDSNQSAREVVAAAREAVENRSTAESLLILTAAYQLANNPSEALTTIDEALKLEPDNPQLIEARQRIAGNKR